MLNKKWLVAFALLVLCIGLGITQASAFTPVYTTNNNFTMLDSTGAVVGGTNDVIFTWDGTLKTSVAVSGQVANATIFSSCPFSGVTWKAHDVAIYGPGTYTVGASCAPKSPGCATGTNPITFTVGSDEIGAHILFDWGTVSTNKNIDVVNVWKKSSPFGPSAMWTGACGSNSASNIWDLMSRDAGSGINGYPMVDGGFVGFHANFNMMGPLTNRPVDTLNNNFTMNDPIGGLTGGTNDVRFTWDGTMKTSVAVSGQVSNATLTSPCPFLGNNWFAHDLAIYGPGTYTVYTTCPGGSPGCGTGTPYTFTVNAGEIGGHMLFNWGIVSSVTTCGLAACDIDVVDVWKPGSYDQGVNQSVCAPALMWTGACGSNPATTVWDFMSYDWDGDCVNGAGMVDGPTISFNANYNMFGVCAGCGVCDPPDCNDNNACTIDACVDNMCVHTPVNCNDNNACTVDTCNTATGCVNTPIICNDNNVCTTDSCDPARGCVFTPVPEGTSCDEKCPLIYNCGGVCISGTCNCYCCNDNNPCTIDTLNPAAGCVFTPINCDDNNACTIDSCNSATGQCVHTPIVCNDNNACTTDTCNPATGNCVFTPIVCNDNNGCTTDSCNPSTGCVYTPISVGDNDPCTIDTCNPLTGAVFTPKNCDDNNPCTTDTCDRTTGNCVHTPANTCISSSNNNFTMIDPTNTTFGGTNDVQFSWDGTRKTSVALFQQISNATLTSSCPFFGVTWSAHDVAIYGPGTYTVYSGCGVKAPGCGTGIPITFTVGLGEIGGHILFDWQGNLNIDVVNVWQPNAVFAPSSMWTGACGAGDAAQIWNWTSKDVDGDGINGLPMTDGPFTGFNANFNMMGVPPCSCNPEDCNDNNACTIDTCDQANGCVCVHTPINCNDNNACTTDSCNPATGCVFTPIVCNDNNACTADSCNPATGCVFTPIVCNDNNACTADSCNSATGCVFTPIVCNDNNTCTADFCDPATGACVYTALPDGTACTANSQAGTCKSGQCIASPVCPAGMVKSITVRGGGQKPTSVDLEIQTNFTVENDGCVGAATNGVTCTPGTIMLVNVNAGIGPMPSSCTWKGAPISTDSLFTIECPAASGDVGKLICDNKLSGGKDVDRITISVQ